MKKNNVLKNILRLIVIGNIESLIINKYDLEISKLNRIFIIFSIFENIIYLLLSVTIAHSSETIFYYIIFFLIYLWLFFMGKLRYYVISTVALLTSWLNIIFFFYLNKFRETVLFWSLFFPFFIIPLKGVKSGLIWNIAFLFSNVFIFKFFSNSDVFFTKDIILYILSYLIVMSFSVSQAMIKKRQLRFFESKMYRDELTQLKNRGKLLIDLKERQIKYLVLANIDGFKEINSFFGHIIGDRILFEIGDILKKNFVVKKSEVYKLHADEFAIAIYTDIEEMFLTAKVVGLYKFIQNYKFNVLGHEIPVNLSFGIASSRSDGYLIEKADIALKLAKSKKKEFFLYDHTLNIAKQYESNLAWARVVKSAVRNNRIIPYFQGLYNNKTGKIEKYECLARLIDEKGKVISPYFFIDVSQRIKLYPEITKIMIKKSFDYFRNREYSFSINFLPVDLLDIDTMLFVENQIKDFPSPERIIFEIVETEEIENYLEIYKILKKFKDYGVQIAIDDFGTGYSSYYQVLKLEADIIKIDGSLIKFIDEDENCRLVVKNIVNFAKDMNKKVIAEFVHSNEVFEVVNALGVEYSQGFYFSEPSPEI